MEIWKAITIFNFVPDLDNRIFIARIETTVVYSEETFLEE
jgi:hypothetical protein